MGLKGRFRDISGSRCSNWDQDEEVSVDTGDRLLTPGEVAALFRVDPKTVTRWAAAGRIGSIRTPGGHRRFRESEVKALLEGGLDFEDETAPPPTGIGRQAPH